MIFVHELGHYTFARIFKVGIYEFSIGMGPRLISKTSKKTGIVYSLRLLPIGGFVSMVGEDGENDAERAPSKKSRFESSKSDNSASENPNSENSSSEISQSESSAPENPESGNSSSEKSDSEETIPDNSLSSKPAWQRAIILAAGAVINILVGIILMVILTVTSSGLGSNRIGEFADGATSNTTGLQAEDTVIRVGNMNTHIYYDLSYAIMRYGTEPVDVTVIRDGKRVEISGVEFPTSSDDVMSVGLADFKVHREDKNFSNIVKHSFYRSAASIKMIWDSLFDLVSGRYGVDQLSGPVGVTSAIGDAAKSGASNLIFLSAIIAINLGIFNLLPLPALDGGRIFFLIIFGIYEKITKKKPKPEIEGYIHFIGFALLMVVFVLITFKDITRLIKR